MSNYKNDAWKNIVRSLQGITNNDPNLIDNQWIMCYTDGTRNIVLEHKHDSLDDILQAFEDFCKGCGFVFDGFAIVDEDGIPVSGLNPLAKLEGNENEDSSGQ